MKHIINILTVFITATLMSCGDGRDVIYEDVANVPAEGWKISEPIRFSINVTDTTQEYDFYIFIRHRKDYKWSNLFLFLKTYYPDNNYSRDTLEFMLAEPSGKWLGKGSGSMKEKEWLFKRIKFNKQGMYLFEFIQGMREEELPGIDKIGISIAHNS